MASRKQATSPAPRCERPWAQACSMRCCDNMSSSRLARDSRAGMGHPGTGCTLGTSPRQAATGHEVVGTPGHRAPGKGQAGMGALLPPRAVQGKVTPSSRWDAQRAQLLASWRRAWWAHCQDFAECHLSPQPWLKGPSQAKQSEAEGTWLGRASPAPRLLPEVPRQLKGTGQVGTMQQWAQAKQH